MFSLQSIDLHVEEFTDEEEVVPVNDRVSKLHTRDSLQPSLVVVGSRPQLWNGSHLEIDQHEDVRHKHTLFGLLSMPLSFRVPIFYFLIIDKKLPDELHGPMHYKIHVGVTRVYHEHVFYTLL